MKRVAIESPFAGDVEFNLKYLDLCIIDCARRGETPYASHRMLVTALDDKNPRERELGVKLGIAMSRSLDIRAFYIDLGMSSGMQKARTSYEREGILFEDRSLGSIYGDIPTAIHRMLYKESRVGTADKLAFLEQENKRLRGWISDLQSGMYVNCVYCGHRYGPEDEVPVSMAETLKKHIEVCPEHPMSTLKQERDNLENELRACRVRLNCLDKAGGR